MTPRTKRPRISEGSFVALPENQVGTNRSFQRKTEILTIHDAEVDKVLEQSLGRVHLANVPSLVLVDNVIYYQFFASGDGIARQGRPVQRPGHSSRSPGVVEGRNAPHGDCRMQIRRHFRLRSSDRRRVMRFFFGFFLIPQKKAKTKKNTIKY